MDNSDKEMVIYCNVSDCIYNEPLPEGEKHYVGEDRKGVTPFEDDYYEGTCSCGKLFVRIRNVDTYNTRHEIPECKCFSLKVRRGHLDFSRFPQGGNVG